MANPKARRFPFRRLILPAIATIWWLTDWSAAGDAWQTIKCVPIDRATEAMFDVAQPLDTFEAEGNKWEALQGGQNARTVVRRDTAEHHGGAACLRVDYEFVGRADYEYIQLNLGITISEAGYGFGFWLKHDGTPFALRLRCMDVSGETHQADLVASDRAGWQFVAGLVDAHAGVWGGDAVTGTGGEITRAAPSASAWTARSVASGARGRSGSTMSHC